MRILRGEGQRAPSFFDRSPGLLHVTASFSSLVSAICLLPRVPSLRARERFEPYLRDSRAVLIYVKLDRIFSMGGVFLI